MPIPEKVVAEVVKEASLKMRDPKYAQTLVGSWVQAQPSTVRYLTSCARDLGGAEGVVNAVFHAALLDTCFLRHAGRRVRAMTFAELDSVSGLDREAELSKLQPALVDYLNANVEGAEMRRVLMLVALAMDAVF
jgi:hypothetical protein